MAHKEIDHATGVDTTGHVWDDDLKELNRPLPRWWLYTFYACILWSVGYFVVYPSWPVPGGYTEGIWKWTSRGAVMQEVATSKLVRGDLREKLAAQPVDAILKDKELLPFATRAGEAAFATNCVACHGAAGRGAPGYPNLQDDDWLWGGSVADIQETLLHGIRSTDDKATRDAGAMPARGADGSLTDAEISDVADYVLSLSGKGAANANGKKIYEDKGGCAACHGADAKGNVAMGAPNLADGIWLFGSAKKDVVETIANGRAGVMPAWGAKLDNSTIKALTVYLRSLGGSK